jgi:hypothetical protein
LAHAEEAEQHTGQDGAAAGEISVMLSLVGRFSVMSNVITIYSLVVAQAVPSSLALSIGTCKVKAEQHPGMDFLRVGLCYVVTVMSS